MKRFLAIFFILNLLIAQNYSQTDSTHYSSQYRFILQDSPAQLFSMRQFNQGYLSGYRLLARSLNHNIKREKLSGLIQFGLLSFFLTPLSHEEGHRSILTGKNIGSISKPYFNKAGAAYVTGVTDQDLLELRNNDLPNYIRLHSGGLESDYMLTRRAEDLSIFEQDNFNNIKFEYWVRKLGILQYKLTSLFGLEIDLEEEVDELKRDIVDYDTYGMARHLHRPTDSLFYRYTKYADLTIEEQKFTTRMGIRSLLNLANPLIIGKTNFKLSKTIKYNVGLGYMLAPFGDFIDENIWLKINNKVNLKIYGRQFQSKSFWFPAGGIELNNYQIKDNLFIDVKLHAWKQPKNLNFTAFESFHGGAFETDLKYFLKRKYSNTTSLISIDLGTIIKTEGFLPEELFLEKKIGIRTGISIWLDPEN